MLRKTRWSPRIRERDTIGQVWRDREVHETGDITYCLKELVLARSDHLHPAPHQSATAAASVKHWQATTGNKSNVSNKTGAYVSPWWMILLS